jgi:hypothetical protein
MDGLRLQATKAAAAYRDWCTLHVSRRGREGSFRGIFNAHATCKGRACAPEPLPPRRPPQGNAGAALGTAVNILGRLAVRGPPAALRHAPHAARPWANSPPAPRNRAPRRSLKRPLRPGRCAPHLRAPARARAGRRCRTRPTLRRWAWDPTCRRRCWESSSPRWTRRSRRRTRRCERAPRGAGRGGIAGERPARTAGAWAAWAGVWGVAGPAAGVAPKEAAALAMSPLPSHPRGSFARQPPLPRARPPLPGPPTPQGAGAGPRPRARARRPGGRQEGHRHAARGGDGAARARAVAGRGGGSAARRLVRLGVTPAARWARRGRGPPARWGAGVARCRRDGPQRRLARSETWPRLRRAHAGMRTSKARAVGLVPACSAASKL